MLKSLPFRLREYQRGEEIITAHSWPQESCLIVEGFTARAVDLEDGTRQVTGVQVPGDFVDLDALLLRQIDHSVVALSACTTGFTPHKDLIRVTEQAPHLGRMLWLATVIDGAIQRTWIANLGRRSPVAHVAHLVCELYLRLEAAGCASGHRLDFPITQQQLADVLGLSTVHTNRTVQELRRTGLITWMDGTVHILNFHALTRLAAFDPTYLSLAAVSR
ncbi:Crp/Fnr family transcriptional regulator [Roseococcus sp. YIM B11640]|uniref:Crp/Fnr family transcriptional regulator n=1 Tax=Roseococcus sp. YIM B11640 TaxID=3133973 RepID=UPI003C7D6FFC